MKILSAFLIVYAISVLNCTAATAGDAEYFLLRPGVETAYGYSHAVKIGRDIKISGAVSMDDEGNPTANQDRESRPRIKTIANQDSHI